MSFKRRLGGVGSSDLNTLAKCLQALLLPEYCMLLVSSRNIRRITKHTRHTSTNLYITDTVLISAENGFRLQRYSTITKDRPTED